MSLFEILLWSPVILMAGLVGSVLGVTLLFIALLLVGWFIQTTFEILAIFINFLTGVLTNEE